MRLMFLLLTFFLSATCFSKDLKIITEDFKQENLTFNYLASDGSFWLDCKHVKGEQPHSWTAYCGQYIFKLHLVLNEYQRENEATFEFHYWADEFDNLKETHTQSTWLSIDQNAKPKKIIGYLGFTQDANQLRIEIKL